jgi:stress response protein YsnF
LVERHGDKLAELEERYTGYEVRDRDGEEIGKVDYLFTGKNNDLEYVGVKTALSGTRAVLIPMGAARVDEGRRVIEVSRPKSEVEEGPAFGDDEKITPEFEERVRGHYGLGNPRDSAEQDASEEERTRTERLEDPERRPGTATGGFEGERGEPRDHRSSADHEDATHGEAETSFAGYQIYDRHYEKIGKVDDLFVDEDDRPEYIGVKMGFLGTRSTLIPMDIARVNDKRRLVEVEADKDTIEEGPTFGHDREVTPEFEQRVLSYYRVETAQVSAERGAYGPYYPGAASDERVDTLPGERAGTHERLDEGQPRGPARSADRERGSGLADEDEVVASRNEEEIRTGAPEDQTGGVNVHKRVRTDR